MASDACNGGQRDSKARNACPDGASREVTENLNTRAAIHGSQQQADQLKAQVADQLLKQVVDSLGIGAEGPSNAEIKGLL